MITLRMIKVCRSVGLMVFLASSASYGQDKSDKKDGEAHKILRNSNLKWTPIIKGCSIAAVVGDFNVDGQPFVLRFHCDDGAVVPAHWHPTDENMTVLKGTFLLAMGEAFDEAKLRPMNSGNFIFIPKEMRHFGKIKGDTVVQIHGTGPFKVNWVNPSDVQPPDTPSSH